MYTPCETPCMSFPAADKKVPVDLSAFPVADKKIPDDLSATVRM